MIEKNPIRSEMIAEIGKALRSVSARHECPDIVDAEAARDALTAILAMMLEADPAVATHQNMREECHRVAREIRPQLGQMRNDYRLTGDRPWCSQILQSEQVRPTA